MSANNLSEQLLPIALDAVQRTGTEQIITDPSFAGKLIGGVAVALAVGIAADNAYGTLRTRSNEPTFTVHKAEHGAADDVVAFYYSGFNSAPAKSAEVHQRAVSKFCRLVVINEAPAGYDAEALNTAVTRQTKDMGAKTVVTLGASMGGTKFIPLESSLHLDDGLEVLSVKDCSPTSMDTIKGSRPRMLNLLAALDTLHLYGGPGFRTVAETVGHALENKHGNQRYRQAFNHALNKLSQTDLPTNRQAQRSATFMKHHQTAPYLATAPDIHRVYLSPEDPERDDVVDTVGSIHNLNQGARFPVENITSQVTGHANPCEEPAEYNRMVTEALQSLGLRSADERRATVSLC